MLVLILEEYELYLKKISINQWYNLIFRTETHIIH